MVAPLERPMFDAINKNTFRKQMLVKIHTDAGLVGYGDSAFVTAGGTPRVERMVIEEEIAPRLIGQDPLRIERLWQMSYTRSFQHGRGGIFFCAMGGVDIALWDILGKAAGLPLYRILGGYSNRIKAYASGGFYGEDKSTDDLVDEVKGYLARGFRAVKIKVGWNDTPMNPSGLNPLPYKKLTLREDLDRVQAVRAAIGPDIALMVDANCAWDLHTALKMGREFDKLGVSFFEEPLRPDYWRESAILADKLDADIAGYETERQVVRYAQLIESRAVDHVQPDPSYAGGISECKKIADLAYAHNIQYSPHVIANKLVLAVGAHLLGGVYNAGLLEVDGTPNPLRSVVKNQLEPDAEGYVNIPESPGLGVELDEGEIGRFHEEYLRMFEKKA
ncbi:MAG: mandelate racemase/muconate lactonizing enzyme family protein [Planctomycetota bacterium]|nr:mandelate racemase/muconate lactonizing enzyme family protein [Planctomycetota bacterium]